MIQEATHSDTQMTFEEFKREVLEDFRLACISREASLLGRKEVLTGKAKFGIFGDGKEVAQIALAKQFKKGDWRSGYYRDQTWMLALGEVTVEQLFAQLYANTDHAQEPMSGGRQMNAHFATRLIDNDGEWLDQTVRYNSSADASPTASQMPRSLGLALASKLYRQNSELAAQAGKFTTRGDEVSFVSIGDASTSEGLFWETVNAAGVMQVPLAISVWDDGYGISVPKKYQTTKESISEVLRGFAPEEHSKGVDIYVCAGWNYPALVQTYKEGVAKVRRTHTPAVFHITELTQPQGHSTSGSHERYKSAERMQWERTYDCIVKMREWMVQTGIATEEECNEIQDEARKHVLGCKTLAWKKYTQQIKTELAEAAALLREVLEVHPHEEVAQLLQQLQTTIDPVRKDIFRACRRALYLLGYERSAQVENLRLWTNQMLQRYQQVYSSHQHSETPYNALRVPEVKPVYSDTSPVLNGYEILNRAFDEILARNMAVVAFGEDVGKIGDVNQGFSGLQEKHGEHRVFDTGIREATIIGQGIGLAMRGFRPIAEIQYLDYLLYGLQPLSDDVACLQYRTRGTQRAPLIVRTRGHRLEGIWHTGSPMGMIIHSLRGMYVCVPRNMVQAAGMYNTLLRSDEPALIIECLNGYRLKEKLPDNIAEFTVPLGVPEVLQQGDDVTLVTYGSCVRIAQEALAMLQKCGISVELIDVQTLLPFDVHHTIIQSVKKTNRVVFLDEDVPGGASAYMFQKVFEEQGAYRWLDSEPRTITAKEHRAAYGTDGDYFSKPNAEDVFETIYAIMHEVDPETFPQLR
ncbi:MAG: thiamine pyrophosphate-dependent enzyme [Chitinophagales bacterium]|nr:thiamine pyrophosphate-dependent enzyme [Chitinophagales bacterium]MDW8418884.1 thiamine pyrophosphate-dependent enzyme [Chitinophagales bacterium]